MEALLVKIEIPESAMLHEAVIRHGYDVLETCDPADARATLSETRAALDDARPSSWSSASAPTTARRSGAGFVSSLLARPSRS